MNPEEGDLRPQLLDRFAFSVEIHGILDKRQRVEIMRRNLGFETDPRQFHGMWLDAEEALSKQIAQARKLLPHVAYTSRDLLIIADLTSSMEVDGHRLTCHPKGACAQAAFEGRAITLTISPAAELAPASPRQSRTFRKSKWAFRF